LNWVKRQLAAAQPADLIFLAYVLLSGLLILMFGWRLSPGLWIGLTLSHLAILAIGVWWSGRVARHPSVAGFFRDTYPLLFIAFLYWELRYLALLFSSGYYDSLILRWEEAVFGEQLAMTLSQRLPYLWLSETMHFFYASYWYLLLASLVALYLRRRFGGFRQLVFAELIVYFGCYIIFTFLPVAGPHYQFPLIGGHLSDGIFYRFVHWVLEDGGSKGAAFPSSHVAVAVTITLVTWRYDRVVCLVTLPFVVGLTISTVYGRFHYGIDAASGVLAAVVLVVVANAVHHWLARIWSAQPGNAALELPV
jgi:membrane-associated phospholipid phosphatase